MSAIHSAHLQLFESSSEILVPQGSRDFPEGFGLRLAIQQSDACSLVDFVELFKGGILETIDKHGVLLAENVQWGETPAHLNRPAPTNLYCPPHVDGRGSENKPTPWALTALTPSPAFLRRDPTHFAPTFEWEEQLKKSLKGHHWMTDEIAGETLWGRVCRETALIRDLCFRYLGDQTMLDAFKARIAESYQNCPMRWEHQWKPNTALFYGTAYTPKGGNVLHARLNPQWEGVQDAISGWDIA